MTNSNYLQLMLESNKHNAKPTNVGSVKKNLKHTTFSSTEDLAHYLVDEGRTMQPNTTCGNGYLTSIDWRSQEIFALDVDNDPPKDITEAHKKGTMSDTEYNEYLHTDYPNKVTPDQIIERCHSYGLNPCFVYSSFNDTEYRRKFRLVFRSNTLITVPAIHRAIVQAMRTIVPESDQSCVDMARIFFGGKSLIYTDFDATFDPISLITQSMPMYLRDHDKKNYMQNLTLYCKDARLNICNSLPDVRPVNNNEDITNYSNQFFKEIGCNSIIYNIELHAKSLENNYNDLYDWGQMHSDSFYGYTIYQNHTTQKYFVFNFAKTDIKERKSASSAQSNAKQGKVTCKPNKIKVDYDLIERFDFDALKDNCRLYREAIDGTEWFYDDVLTGIAHNLACIKGGESRYTEIIDKIMDEHSESYDTYKEYNLYNKVEYAQKMGYCPDRCENFCPYKDQCHNEGLNMLSANPKKINNKIRKLDDTEITYISKTDAENDTYMAISEALTANDNKIHCIKAPTGIGKTQIYTSMNLSNVCVALPTHDLKDEVYGRILKNNTSGHNIVCKQNFDCPDNTVNQKYQQLLNVGEYSEATKYLYDSVCNPQYSRDTLNYISNYLNNIDSLKRAETVITTHANALHLKNPNIETYLFDEDVTQSLLQITEYNPDDLTILIHQMEIEYGDDDLTTKQLKEIQKIIDSMPQFIYTPFPKVKISDTKKLNRCIATLADRLSTNIPNILTSDFIIKNENNILCAKSNISQLKADKTYIILSATLDHKMLEYVFKDRLVFTDIGNIRIDNDIDCTTGTIYQYPKYSTARAAIRSDVSRTISYIENSVPNIDKNINMITFANCEQLFKNNGFTNQIAHFGACSGIDAYGGQDLLVVGTPHINQDAYMLYALMLGKKVSSLDCDDCKLKRQNVKRNGYEFTFMTFEDNFLQTIQLWAIEQELYQAIGRARALRNECNVYVFSNLPLMNTRIAA